MSGIVEGTTGPALGTDTAVLRRSVDMATYTSSQETSRQEHPQHCVETRKISNSRPSNKARSLPRKVKTGLHAWTGRHGASMLVKNVEPMYVNKISIFYSTTPRSQQVVGVSFTTTTSSGQGTVTSSIDNRLFGYYNKQWVGYGQQQHDNSLKQENDSDNHNTLTNWYLKVPCARKNISTTKAQICMKFET